MEGNNAGAEVTRAKVSSTLNQPAVSIQPTKTYWIIKLSGLS